MNKLDSYKRHPLSIHLPEWLLKLEAAVFDELSQAEADSWPVLFAFAAESTGDFRTLFHRVSIRRISRILAISQHAPRKCLDEIESYKQLHEQALTGGTFRCIKTVASLGDYADPAKLTVAAIASGQARSARSAAELAALLAKFGREGGARSKAWKCEADDLLSLMKGEAEVA